MEPTPDSFLEHLRLMRAQGFSQSMLLQLLGDPRGFEKKKTAAKGKVAQKKEPAASKGKEPAEQADGKKAQKNKSLLEWFKAIDKAVGIVDAKIGHMPGLSDATDFKLWRLSWKDPPMLAYRDKVKKAALEGGEVVHKEDPITGVDTSETFTKVNLTEDGFLWKIAETSSLGPLNDKTSVWCREIKPLFPSLTPLPEKPQKELKTQKSATDTRPKPKAKASGSKANQARASQKPE